MADKKETLPRVSDRALEWVMHDMLGGLLELSRESARSDGSATPFRTAKMQPEKQPPTPNVRTGGKPAHKPRQAKILPFPAPGKQASGGG